MYAAKGLKKMLKIVLKRLKGTPERFRYRAVDVWSSNEKNP